MQASETELMLKGYGLTTPNSYYPCRITIRLLNSFIWQRL